MDARLHQYVNRRHPRVLGLLCRIRNSPAMKIVQSQKGTVRTIDLESVECLVSACVASGFKDSKRSVGELARKAQHRRW